jgi:hypothetical protein
MICILLCVYDDEVMNLKNKQRGVACLISCNGYRLDVGILAAFFFTSFNDAEMLTRNCGPNQLDRSSNLLSEKLCPMHRGLGIPWHYGSPHRAVDEYVVCKLLQLASPGPILNLPPNLERVQASQKTQTMVEGKAKYSMQFPIDKSQQHNQRPV